MKTCTFFGHRDAPQSLRAPLKLKITQLIIQQGVDCFYVGNHGQFDAMALSVLQELAPIYPQIKYYVVYAYLPKEKTSFALKMNEDARGSFTELLKTDKCGQFSVNISKPGVTKGQHWHNTKWEFFIVVSGRGLIQQRKIGSDEVMEFYVSGDKIEAVHMLPGYTHNIINLSQTENLVTLMWANEQFDPARPDTFFEEV